MKKTIAVVMAVVLLFSTTVTAMLTVSADTSPVTTTVVDLTQAPTVTNMGTSPNNTTTSAIATDGKWTVSIANYLRKLSECTPSTGQTWLPNIALRDSEGNGLAFGVGNKIIVEVKYKVLSVQSNTAWATSIGIGGWSGAAGSNIMTAVYRSHPDAADVGKEFTLVSVATVASNTKVPKIAFSGGGQLEISSITVHELPAANISDYAVVKYVDDGVESNEFAPKNGALKAPVKDGYTFEGWYADSEFSGDAVTTVTADTTLYAKWAVNPLNTVNVDLSQTPNIYKPGSGAENMTFTADGDVLKVHVAYTNTQYAFSKHTNGNSAWLPHYKVYDNGAFLLPSGLEGAKVSVEVQYRLVGSEVHATHGAQIGIVTGTAGNEYKYHKSYKQHTAADLGKAFSLSTTFTVQNANDRAIKLAFLGGGDFEITSIVVKYVAAAYVADYAAVQYIDGDQQTADILEKNGALKVLPNKEGYIFAGWYASADFSGEAVTAATGDMTVYAKWRDAQPLKTVNVDLSQPLQTYQPTSETGTSFALEDGVVKVHVQRYSDAFSSYTNGTQVWYSHYKVYDNGVHLLPAGSAGTKVSVEVQYRLVGSDVDGNYGAQIGITTGTTATASLNLKSYKKHIYEDLGKEFSLSAAYTVQNDNDRAIKIAFTGRGDFEITSIVVKYVAAEYADEYAAVKYIDGDRQTADILEKNGALKVLPDKEGYKFGGWYASADFSGEKVTAATGDMTVYAKWKEANPVKTVNVDLSQELQTYQPTSETATTFALEDGIVKVHVERYSNSFSDHKDGTNVWYAHYKVYDNGVYLLPENSTGTKVAVEVQYKLVGSSVDGNFGAQIGITTGTTGNESTNLKSYKKHIYEDLGKAFSLSAAYTVQNNSDRAIKIAFTGRGDFEITSIVVKYVAAEYADEYAAVKYIDGDQQAADILENGSALATPDDKLEYSFAGWFDGDTQVTAAADKTVTAKWVSVFDVNTDNEVDIRDLVHMEIALRDGVTDLSYDVDRNGTVNEDDLTAIRNKLLGVITVGGTDITAYTVRTQENASLMTAKAATALVDSLKK